MNRQWIYANRPVGPVSPDNFEYRESPVPEPGDGQALVRLCWLSFEPAMRTWMEDFITYMPPAPLGQPMIGPGVCQVVASDTPDLQVGDLVSGMMSWQDYHVVDGTARKVPPETPIPVMLGPLGGTGLTAYIGLLDIGRPQPGDTVLVSGAAGATGSVTAQIARIKGCRAVGIAGGADKCRWLLDEARLDEAIDYKNEDVDDRLAEACGDGVDVYFDNVGGDLLETVLGHMNQGGRIAACGAISTYNQGLRRPGPANMFQFIEKRLTLQGFVMFDHMERVPAAQEDLGRWVADGEIAFQTDIQSGFENIPSTFLRLFSGANQGKQLLKVRDPEPC
ncbi:NADP-dependent oxidoreductase [Candidatus Poriferisocius sp.]|uniref:NADP-dependent oxidoreductase n=1 Tax=Candidatus Poriferisocius sp. TaxID=3101276 RepID=UPI003B5A6CA3